MNETELNDFDILWLETPPTSAEPMYKDSKKKYFEAIQNYPYKSHSIDQGLNDSERKNYAVLFCDLTKICKRIPCQLNRVRCVCSNY